jgi:serine/threonine protein kinase
MLSPDSILQNRYRIVRELGRGGMGTVYEALDQRVNCIVALKETGTGGGEEARRAFEREASLLGNLRHSALPKVTDYFTERDGDFLVMEFIPGYDLEELIESRDSAFPQTQVLRWADELLRVLEYLHKQDPPILHRDIKPSNLKLTRQGELFLLDFGLAKGAVGQMSTLATSRSVRGYTPVYASLEQIHGYGTDARSDIYSLGATLYHLITGVAPVDAPRRFHVIEEEEPDPLARIEKLNPQASKHVSDVIHQAMAVNRKQRQASAAEMRNALRNAAEEDERSSAEEEYARAEARRRARNLKREEGSTAPLPRAVPPPLETERGEEKPAPPPIPPTALDPTVGPSETKAEASSPAPPIQTPIQTPPIQTMVAPPPEKVAEVPATATNRSYASFDEPVAKKNYTMLIVAAAVVVGLVVGLIVWMMMTSGSTRETAGISTSSQPASSTSSTSSTSPTSSMNKPTAPEGMVYVPGGTFMMGRDNGADEAEQPEHQVNVKPFFIDQYEVVVDQYETWRQGTHVTSSELRPPATGVNWDNASGYCKAIGKRLPTEEEWEFAARGTDGRVYPWGNNWQDAVANAAGQSKRTSDVGVYKNGSSPFGAYDMIGNVWEWTSSDFRAYPGGRLPASVPSGGDLKVIRGGSYESTRAYATTTYRTGWPARGAKTYDQTGFRCVKDVQ